MPGTLPTTPRGLVVAVQYYSGDLAEAMRLVRLIADIEPAPRGDVTLALVRRHDLAELSPLERETARHVSGKMPVLTFRSRREGSGHPDGCNALFAGAMDHLAGMWARGELHRSAVFLAEADGCPLRRDWIDCLMEAHRWTVMEGKSVTGAAMSDVPHLNGSSILEIPWWINTPSVHRTPPDHAFDIFHANTYLAAARRTARIVNFHGSTNWSPESLRPMSREVAWLLNTKDDSVIRWAETELVSR